MWSPAPPALAPDCLCPPGRARPDHFSIAHKLTQGANTGPSRPRKNIRLRKKLKYSNCPSFRGFQVTDIFNIYSKVSSYMDICQIFKLRVSDIFKIYSNFKLHGYSLYIQISSQSNFWMHRSLEFEYPANIPVT